MKHEPDSEHQLRPCFAAVSVKCAPQSGSPWTRGQPRPAGDSQELTDRQTDRHGDTKHSAGRQTEAGTEQPAHQSGQVLSLRPWLTKCYSNQAPRRTFFRASSPAFQKCLWLGSHQNLTDCTTRSGCPSFFINALKETTFHSLIHQLLIPGREMRGFLQS